MKEPLPFSESLTVIKKQFLEKKVYKNGRILKLSVIQLSFDIWFKKTVWFNIHKFNLTNGKLARLPLAFLLVGVELSGVYTVGHRVISPRGAKPCRLLLSWKLLLTFFGSRHCTCAYIS